VNPQEAGVALVKKIIASGAEGVGPMGGARKVAEQAQSAGQVAKPQADFRTARSGTLSCRRSSMTLLTRASTP
jgi:hypothetical protein